MNNHLPESVRRMFAKACEGAPTWTPEQLATFTALLKRDQPRRPSIAKTGRAA